MAASTSEELKAYWTNLSDWYLQTAVKVTTNVFHSYAHMLKLDEAERVLEAGCGNGNGIPIILSHASQTTEIFGTDLTPALLDKAREKNFPRTTLQEANSEALPFPENHFDRYIANLSLQIVTDPEQMLREAYRVTRPGALCAFSVWGDRETCQFMTWSAKAIKEVGIELPEGPRSNFHLNDKEQLRSMILNAGFSQVLCFENAFPLPYMNEDEITRVFEGMPMLAQYKETGQFDSIISTIRGYVRTLLQSGNLPCFSSLVALVVK